MDPVPRPETETFLPSDADEIMRSVADEVIDAEQADQDEAEQEEQGEAGDGTDREVSSDTVMIVDALGMTWSAFQLYPEPASTPAWLRAMDIFAESEGYPSYAEVTPDYFEAEAGPVESIV